MNKKSDYIRTITLKIHTPAIFKFTKGNWESQAEIAEINKGENITVKKLENHTTLRYQIKDWF